MRTTSALKTAVLLTAAVVLGLGTVQGSLAVWNTTAGSAAGTIRSADFDVTLGAGAGSGQRLSVDGKPSTVAMPAITGLTPEEPRTTSIKVTNATSSGSGTFTVQLTSGIVGNTPAPLSTKVWFSTSDKCLASTPTARLTEGGSTFLCVRATLAKEAPATFSSQKNTFSVRLTAAQV